jgi:RHS repeat-associated protein
VRYWNGTALISDNDLSIPFGGIFGHERYYNNQTSGNYDGPNGYNWFVTQLPYAVGSGTSVAIVFNPNEPYWFDLSGGSYVARYGTMNVSLVANTTTHTFTFTQTSNGQMTVTVFNDFTVTAAPGGFISYTDARGIQTTVTSQTGSQINQLQRTYTISGTTTYETLDYAYFTSGSAVGKLQTLTFSRKIGSGATVGINRVTYAYYGTSNTHGSQNDLQSASQLLPDTSGGWTNPPVAVFFYRYYKIGAAKGFVHALKMRFGPEAYRLMFNAGVNPITADDSAVMPYADHYFEYDPSTRRVTKEVSAVCETCPGGGTTTDLFTYTDKSPAPTSGYNVWARKAVQMLPDSSQIIVYTNYCGMPMLSVIVDPSGSNKWCTFYRYDANGNTIWIAMPSAINGYDDTYDDLLNYDTGTGLYQYVNNTSGLIKINTYYSTTGSGAVAGYIQYNQVQQGQSGTPVTVRSYTYSSNTASGVTIYPINTQVDYPVAGSTTPSITTTFTYTYYSGTNNIHTKTTTLPTISSGQNGSGSSYTTVETYDAFGNLTQTVDERGVTNTYTYSGILSLKTQQILNYVSGVTQPGVNVTSNYTYDNLGRLIQTLGPSHTANPSGGSAASVRKADWVVYTQSTQPSSGTWSGDQIWTGSGYTTGSGPSYTYNLVNPVSITIQDKDGRTTDQITSRRTTGSGALSPTNTFAQTDWQTWTSTQYDNQHTKISECVYFVIPSSGTGTVGTNYGQTHYGYDALERLNRVKSAGGTITRTVWTTPQWVASVWVGTDDIGATDSNPAGSGTPNNMVMITSNQYDGGSAGGDGTLTQVTQVVQYPSVTTVNRITNYAYDFRDRKISMTGEINVYEAYTYDNLDRLTQVDRHNTSSSGYLIGRTATKYDDRNRIYQTLTYAVNPSTGSVGNSIVTNSWYDPSGNLLQRINAGDSKVFKQKSTYNGVNWITANYVGYGSSSSYSEATTVANDTIVSQVYYYYDQVGNPIIQVTYDRLNDTTGLGLLIPYASSGGGSSSSGAPPKPMARVSYTANWFDGISRVVGAANYGALSSFGGRPNNIPTRSDTVLVTTTAYDDAGRVYQVTDPKAIVTQTTYDNASRKTQTIEDYGTGTLNRTTNYTYTLDNLIATLTAVNSVTGNQATTYAYSSTLKTSGVARHDLLTYITYPDTGRVGYTYNSQGEQVTVTDQRGTVHTLYYDLLGRLTDDCVTTVGSGTDNAVLRVSTTYEVRGMVETVTSYNNATPGSGTALNQVALTYNTFSQLIEDAQEHSGAVTGSSADVQYAYDSASSSSNEIRLNAITYPNSRVIDYIYASGIDTTLCRVTDIKDAATSVNLAAYTYLGVSSVVRINYGQAQTWLDLWGGTSGTFNGLDQFNRIVDQRWQFYGTPNADLDRYKYGYDRNSNRVWKQNTVGTALDEFYTYDNLNRLTEMQRGTLNSGKTGITGTPVREMDYTLDPVGNWDSYLTKTSGTTDLNQGRTQSTVNEITAISASGGTPVWATPAYDAAGNMTTLPQPGALTSSFTGVYDAWNRLVQISSSSTTVAKYQYDGMSRRIVKLTYTSGTLSETRHFYYSNQNQDIEERLGTSTSMDKQFIWGIRYVDELVCRDDATPLRLYATQDANFNVTGMISTAGAVQQRFLYDPYGNPMVLSASWSSTTDAYAWTRRFTGQFYDPETLLYFYRARYYHPWLGTFVTRDFVEPDDEINLYYFVRANPINQLDPTGWASTNPSPPTQPAPLPPGTPVKKNVSLTVAINDLLGAIAAELAGNPVDISGWGCGMCAQIDVSGIQNPSGNVTCDGIGCGLFNAAFKGATQCDVGDAKCIGAFLAKSTAGSTINIGCPSSKNCTNQQYYNGQYPVDLTATITVPGMIFGLGKPTAVIKGSLSGNITWKGYIGTCQ